MSQALSSELAKALRTFRKEVILLSAVVKKDVRKGIVCPITGKRKSRGAATSREAYLCHGGDNTAKQAVDAAIEAVEGTYKGHEAALSGDGPARGTISETFCEIWVPAQMEIRMAASNGAVGQYRVAISWLANKKRFETYVFGDISSYVPDENGLLRLVGVFAHKWRVDRQGNKTEYGRFQAVPGDIPVAADTRCLVSTGKPVETRRRDLPSSYFKNRGIEFSLQFIDI